MIKEQLESIQLKDKNYKDLEKKFNEKQDEHLETIQKLDSTLSRQKLKYDDMRQALSVKIYTLENECSNLQDNYADLQNDFEVQIEKFKKLQNLKSIQNHENSKNVNPLTLDELTEQLKQFKEELSIDQKLKNIQLTCEGLQSAVGNFEMNSKKAKEIEILKMDIKKTQELYESRLLRAAQENKKLLRKNDTLKNYLDNQTAKIGELTAGNKTENRSPTPTLQGLIEILQKFSDDQKLEPECKMLQLHKEECRLILESLEVHDKKDQEIQWFQRQINDQKKRIANLGWSYENALEDKDALELKLEHQYEQMMELKKNFIPKNEISEDLAKTVRNFGKRLRNSRGNLKNAFKELEALKEVQEEEGSSDESSESSASDDLPDGDSSSEE